MRAKAAAERGPKCYLMLNSCSERRAHQIREWMSACRYEASFLTHSDGRLANSTLTRPDSCNAKQKYNQALDYTQVSILLNVCLREPSAPDITKARDYSRQQKAHLIELAFV